MPWASSHGRHDIFYHKGRLDLALGDMCRDLAEPDCSFLQGTKGSGCLSGESRLQTPDTEPNENLFILEPCYD